MKIQLESGFFSDPHVETRYYVTIEKADGKQILESIVTFEWSLVKKLAK